MALESKGFGAAKERTFLREIQFRRLDGLVLGLLMLVLILAFYLRIQGKGQIAGLIL